MADLQGRIADFLVNNPPANYDPITGRALVPMTEADYFADRERWVNACSGSVKKWHNPASMSISMCQSAYDRKTSTALTAIYADNTTKEQTYLSLASENDHTVLIVGIIAIAIGLLIYIY